MGKRLTWFILGGMALGVIVGFVLNRGFAADDPQLAAIADYLKLLPDVFLKLIKMIIAPLVFATIVIGIAGMGDSTALGRIGGRALAWFITASLLSLSLGLLLVNLFRPGVELSLEAATEVGELATSEFTLRHFVLEIFPTSAFDAMAQNHILQILVFSLFVGVALSALRERGEILVRGCEALAELMLQITNYVMRFAPFAVFGALASVVATKGLGIIATYGVLVSEFYFGLLLLWILLLSIGAAFLHRRIFEPGVGAPIPEAVEAAKLVGEVKKLDAWGFTLSIFPGNALEALATNNILQILVFSIFAGVALSAIGEKGAPLVRGADALAEMMLQITGYVMRFAPFAVFGAIAKVVAASGLGILLTYFELLVEFYASLVLLWIVLLTMGWVFLRQRIWTLIRYIREPLLLAFSTASSEAALPKMLEQLDRFGVPRRISGFMLPLGYSFNLDGSMMYMSFATIFIAQAYGIDLSIGTQVLILLTLMISSKGIAAVPRASLVVITGTLAQFGLPVEGVAIILAIDQFLDMGRTATNVVGNAVATSVITKWEGMLKVTEPE